MNVLHFIDSALLCIPRNIRIWGERFVPSLAYINHYDSLSRNDFLSFALKRKNQFQRMKSLLIYTNEKVPYYRDLFKQIHFNPYEMRTLSDLTQIPLLEKETVQQNSELFISEDVRKEHLISQITSGSSGMPLTLFFTRRELCYQGAIVRKQYAIAGVDLRDAHILINRAFNKNELFRVEKNHCCINTLLCDEERRKEVIAFLKRQKKYVFIRGFPSYLYRIATDMLSSRERVTPLKAIITGYEVLSDDMRRTIEKAFQCPVFNFYGMNEGVIHGLECSYHRGLHVDMYGTYLEAAANADTDAGTLLIATSLNNYAMPLIRYNTGDVGILRENCTCDCGREGQMIIKLRGRSSDVVQLNDGRTFDFYSLSRILRGFCEIKESRFVYYPNQKLVLEVVLHRGERIPQKLKKRLSSLCAQTIRYEIRAVDTIPRTGVGKMKFVTCVS